MLSQIRKRLPGFAKTTVHKNDAPLDSGETASYDLWKPGASRLTGSLSRQTGTYTVTVAWLDKTGTEIQSTTVTKGARARIQTTFDLPARSPYARVTIEDHAGESGSYCLAAYLR